MWRGIRTRVAERRAARQPVAARPDAPAESPSPASMAEKRPMTAAPVVASGEGNAEEWLGAVPSSLAPATPVVAPVQRIRIRYRKVGPARFIATRELGTVFLRAVRRGGIPIAFSNGHHPLPRIGFGPALPVGVSSDDELVDLELTAGRDANGVLETLARELPDGLEPLDAVTIDRSAPSIDQSTTAHRYECDLGALDVPPAATTVAAAVARFQASDAFPIRKHTKRGERTIDGRHMVRDLAQHGAMGLRFELTAGPEGTLKPSTVVATVLGLPDAVTPLLRIHKRATCLATGAAGAPAPPTSASA